MIDGEQKGPFTLEELPEAGVRPSTYIWCKGLPDWQKAEENPDVCRLFRNRLYDIMHPAPEASTTDESELTDKYKVAPDTPPDPHRSRFDYYLRETGESLPTIDEIEEMEDKEEPPINMTPYAWLVTLFFFFPTGIAALIFAYKSRQQWKAGNHILSHGYCRSAKMWTGISFFLGIIVYGIFLSIFLK